MNFKSRRCFFLAAFFLLTTCSFAQKVFIANDFVACGVGLKDSDGKWIVEPIYQDITEGLLGHYKVLWGSKEGIINEQGKIIVQPIYDFVNNYIIYHDSVPELVFVVTNDGKKGLLNSKNEFIVPMTCRMIHVNNDGTILAEKTKKHFSFYDLKGNETVIPKKQGTEPLSLGGHLFAVSRNAFGVTIVQRYVPYKNPHRKGRRYPGRYHSKLTWRKKYGVINDSMRLIVPKKFSNVMYSAGDFHLLTVQKGKKTGFYNIDGREIWKPVYRISYTFRTRNFYDGRYQSLMNTYGFTAARSHKKYGIIAANGDTILPFIYESIYSPYNNRNITAWLLTIDGKQGIYNPSAREWVLQPEYESLYTIASYKLPGDTTSDQFYGYQYYGTAFYDGPKLYIARKDNKVGIISSEGQVLLPFIYDNYRSFEGAFCFRKDSSYYMVSFPSYHRKAPGYAYDAQKHVVLRAPASLKFTRLVRDDSTVLFINPDLLNDSAQSSLYETKFDDYIINPQTYDHTLHAVAMIVAPLHIAKTLPGVGPVFSYLTTDLNYPKERQAADFVIGKNFFYINTLNYLAKDAQHSYYSVGHTGVYRDDGLRLMRPFSYEYINEYEIRNGLVYFHIDCGKNKSGLIDGNGKLVLDTTWGSIGSSRDNYFWVEKKNLYSWLWTSYSWNILDTTTNKLLLGRKERSSSASSFGKDAVILERPEGDKLYNFRTGKYILNGNVRHIYKLDSAGNYFAVQTCYGNIGIIDGNGRWMADTIWKMVINADNRSYEEQQANAFYDYRRYSYNYRDQHPSGYSVFSNDTSWIIFDATKGIATKDNSAVHYLMAIALNGSHDDSLYGIVKNCNDCPSYSYIDSTNKPQLAAWQERILFDSLFAPAFIPDTSNSWFDYGCSDCRKRNPHQYFRYAWSGNYDKQTLHHTISFQNSSCISVSRNNLLTYYYQHDDPKDLFFTVMLFDDGPHAMLLDSLFEGNEWKTFISGETSLYFESHPHIEGYCHNPYMLPAMMKDRFILTPEGIQLYPPNYKENDRQLYVPISWKKLKPYLRKDVAEKLGVK